MELILFKLKFKLNISDGAKIIAFADDLAVVGVAHTTESLEDLVIPVLQRIDQWMSSNGLSLALDKSECVLLTKKRYTRNPIFTINGTTVPVKRDIRYLRVHLDIRLSFVKHAKNVLADAKKAAMALVRLMPNVGDPKQSSQLLMSVVHSRLLYCSQV